MKILPLLFISRSRTTRGQIRKIWKYGQTIFTGPQFSNRILPCYYVILSNSIYKRPRNSASKTLLHQIHTWKLHLSPLAAWPGDQPYLQERDAQPIDRESGPWNPLRRTDGVDSDILESSTIKSHKCLFSQDVLFILLIFLLYIYIL